MHGVMHVWMIGWLVGWMGRGEGEGGRSTLQSIGGGFLKHSMVVDVVTAELDATTVVRMYVCRYGWMDGCMYVCM